MVLNALKHRLFSRSESKKSGGGLFVSMPELIAQRQNIAYLQNMHQRLITSTQAGNVKSAIKGRGIELEEIRAYAFGDDIRDIDWRVSARKDTPYTKVYNEEKDREIYVLLDLSPYMAFGSRFELKSVSAAKIAALIGWLGIENKDRFGAAIFDGTQTFFYRATNNRSTMPVILNKISSLTKDLLKKKSANGTQLNTALQMLNNYIKERASVFVISSFNMLGESEKKYLSQLSKKSRVFCVNVFDALEINAPIKGEYMIADGEGKNLIFNSGNKLFRAEYQQYFENRKTDFQNFCRRFRIAYAEISPAPDLYAQLKFY